MGVARFAWPARHEVRLWHRGVRSLHRASGPGGGGGVMNKIENVSLRNVMKGIVAAPFLLGARVSSWSPISQASAEPASFAPNLFVAIAATGQVTIVVSRSEMGTGIRTSLAMVLADELDADWRTVHVAQAPGDAKYGDQNTDGSKSV